MYHYLVYLSSASYDFSEDDLKVILDKSRENNLKRNVTGFLFYIERSIFQILEGDKENVLNVFREIKFDNRHKLIIKVKEGSQQSRIFPDVSMGLKSILRHELAPVVNFRDLENFRISLESNEKHPALILLNAFLTSHKVL